MTRFEMNAMLKSLYVKRKGCRLQIFGRAIVDGELATFMALREIPEEQSPQFPPGKMLWFEELLDFNTEGAAQ